MAAEGMTKIHLYASDGGQTRATTPAQTVFFFCVLTFEQWWNSICPIRRLKADMHNIFLQWTGKDEVINYLFDIAEKTCTISPSHHV
jgi:hypothetical protein